MLKTIYKKQEEMFKDIKNKKFCIAKDAKYLEQNDEGEFIKYIHNFLHIDTLNELKKELQNDKHYYEILFNTKRRLYFDFDGLDLTINEASLFISNFKDILERELSININADDYIVLCNENKDKQGNHTEKIQSLHIIVASHKMDFKQQKKLSEYINEVYTLDIDTNVYKSNQKMRMVNQSKLKYGVKLKNFYDGELNISKSLINYTTHLKEIQFTKEYDLLKDQITEKDILQIPPNEIIYFIVKGIYQGASFNHEFFNHNKDWKTITQYILQNKDLYDIEKWIKLSAELTTNPKYTYDNNKEFIKRTQKTNANINTIYKIITKYSSHFIVHNLLNSYISDFLKKYYDDETIKQITHKINITPKTSKKILFKFTTKDNKETIINVKNGFIHFEDETYINMYYDNIPPIKETLFKEVEDINEVRDKTLEFLRNNIKTLIIKSRWGSGKTSNIIKTILKHYKNNRILIITESNTLNNKLIRDFEEYGFISHLDAQKDKKIHLNRCEKVICSIQSIEKIKDEIYDIVILDEYESILSSYTATSTFKSANTTNEKAFNILIDLIQNSDKSLICDADISEDKVRLIYDVIGKENISIYKNNQLTFNNMLIRLYEDKDIFFNRLYQSINEHKKIAVASVSKKTINLILEDIIPKYKNIRILKVIQEGVFITHNETTIIFNKNDVLKDIEKFIIDQEIDLFLYSPTIKTGLSINTDYFDCCYGYSSQYSILYNEFIQMIMRQRKLKDNEIFLFINRYKRNANNKSYETIERQQHIKKQLFNHLLKDSITYSNTEVSPTYYQLQTINNKNAYNSRYNYAYNILQSLQYHHLKYEYIPSNNYKQTNETMTEIDLEQAKETYNDKLYNEWKNTPLLDFVEFTELYKIPAIDRYTNDEVKASYIKTSIIYGLFKIKQLIKSLYFTHFSSNEYSIIKPFNIYEIDQINLTIQNRLRNYDNRCFYDKYIQDNKKDNIFSIYKLHIEDAEYIYLETKEDNQYLEHKIILQRLLSVLGLFVDGRFKTKTLNNRQFKLLLIDNKDFIQELYKYSIKKDLKFNFTNKLHIKHIYHYIKSLLGYIDIHIKYKNKYTNEDYAEFMIFNKTDTINQIYEYMTPYKNSNTLDHLQDESNDFILKIDEPKQLNLSKLQKLIIKKTKTKDEIRKIQMNLLFNDEFIPSPTIFYKGSYYNSLLNPINKDKVIYKEDKAFIKYNRKQERVYKYKTKKNEYFKPYDAKIPEISKNIDQFYQQNKYKPFLENDNDYKEECRECELHEKIEDWNKFIGSRNDLIETIKETNYIYVLKETQL